MERSFKTLMIDRSQKQFNLTRPTVPPDGMPIGDDSDWGGN